jgi:hypothetical protein
MGYTTFCPVFNFTAHFYLNSQAHVVLFSLQFSGIQKPTSQGMAKPRLRSGGHQTDSKPASVLANKASIEGIKQV